MHPRFVKIAQHPFLNLVVGVSLAVSSYMELIDEERAFSAAHGGVLLGFFHIFKFILELMESADLVFEGAKEERIMPRLMRKLSDNFYFHLSIAVSLISVGLIEVAEQLEVEIEQSMQVWHFGLIGSGLMQITNASANFTDALAFASKAGEESKKDWLLKMTDRLHFPKIELSLGIFVVLSSVWEDLISQESGFHLGVHHGLLIFALASIAKVLASMAVAIDTVNNVQLHSRKERDIGSKS